MNNIHESAIIEEGVILGDNITVGPFTYIKKGVSIGSGTNIGSHTLIEGKTTIGEGNEIFSHAVIGSIPQDLKFDGEDVELIIGDRNKIREHTLINPGTIGGGSITKIGNDCLLMGHTHIGHDCIIGNKIVIANSSIVAGHVEIDDNVVVGGMSAIHQFCKIGTHSMIGGGSIVVQDIPPFCICEGNRANLRGLNLNGLRRRVENRADIDSIRKAYKAIFEEGQPIAEVSKEILKTDQNIYVKQLAQFVVDTKRGIPFIRK